MAGTSENKLPPFQLAPVWRSYTDFPWYVWALGWTAVLKASIWFFLEPASLQPIMLWKCLFMSIPYMVLASGVWNLKRWAIAGLAVLGALDLLLLVSGTLTGEGLFRSAELLGSSRDWDGMLILYKAVFLGSRLGDLALIALAPRAWKYAQEWNQGLWREVVDPEDKDGLRIMVVVIYLVLIAVVAHALISGI
ncbi:MAG: hypothetical protein JEZ02_10225 [Desulfatibacillum sp.]|nr:hypothetical protein [Desulfatibacillum sp.]